MSSGDKHWDVKMGEYNRPDAAGSCHDHGNCELCDELEKQHETLLAACRSAYSYLCGEECTPQAERDLRAKLRAAILESASLRLTEGN